MKRREALKSLILVGAGISILPSCNFETFPILDKLPLEKDQFRLIRLVQHTILPQVSDLDEDLNGPLNFAVHKLNDCYKPEDIEKYLSGLSTFQSKLETEEIKFKKTEPSDQLQLLQSILLDEKAAITAVDLKAL
ncbi:MAG: gluconate 2-dehydrogenase subunit 3 family protein, partial [Bacteroidota bacterium]